MPNGNLPKYHQTVAEPLQQKVIDMKLEGVSLRFYPLRASPQKLQQFCDEYLNFGYFSEDMPIHNRPPYSFRPALPFVLLIVLDYNRLEVEGVAPPRQGGGPADPEPVTWLRQHELIFGVPLEWYGGHGKDRRFIDWAMTSPFIYLDHPISIWIGREAYGWPKTSMRVPRLRPVFRPADPQHVVSFEIPRPSGNPEQPERFDHFLDIHTDAVVAPSSPQVTAPFSIMSSAITSFFQGASAFTASLAGLRVPNFSRPDESAATQRMFQQGVSTFSGWLPTLSAMLTQGQPLDLDNFPESPFMKNNITLKQFRDAERNEHACYQALMRSSVTVNKVHAAGLLFNPLLQDPSGGTIVRLHDSPETTQIVERFGLEIDGFDQAKNVKTRILKPYLPFWFDLDLKYEAGEVLSWRGMDTEWSQTNEPRLPKSEVLPAAARYLEIGSGVLPERRGRSTTRVTIRVLPLRATKLAQLCRRLTDDLRDDNDREHSPVFETESEHILLYVIQFDPAHSGDPGPAHGSGLLADTEVVFAIPAIYTDRGKVKHRVLLPMLGFVGTEQSAFSDREIYGRVSLQSSLLPPREKMLEELAPDGKKFEELFYVSTCLCRALNEDQETRLWPILDFVEIEQKWAHHIEEQALAKGELARLAVKEEDLPEWLAGLGLDTVRPQGGFTSIALKQFRDGGKDSTKACYQALVQYEGRFSKDFQRDWINQNLALRIYDCEAVNLVEEFGLLPTNHYGVKARPEGQGGTRVDIIEPDRPFWIKAELTGESAHNLCHREGAGPWREA